MTSAETPPSIPNDTSPDKEDKKNVHLKGPLKGTPKDTIVTLTGPTFGYIFCKFFTWKN